MIGVASQTTCTRKAFAAQGKNGRCNTVAKAAAAEVATVKKGPMLEKKYHGPHSVAEDGIERIVSMLRKGDLFRYGGQDEGSLQVCVCVSAVRFQSCAGAQTLRRPTVTYNVWHPC